MVEMSFRSRKRLLWSANVVFTLGILSCSAVMIFLPMDPRVTRLPEQKKSEMSKASGTSAAQKVAPLEKYAAIYQRDLRKPLFDAAPGVSDPSKPKRTLAVTFVGMAEDPGLTYGFFRDSHGNVLLVRIGQKIEEAEVMSIVDGVATLKFEGDLVTLSLPGKQKKP